MGALGGILMFVGGITCLVGSIMILIQNFKVNVLWGVASLILGIPMLVFVAMHWDVSKKGFLIWAGGFVAVILGIVLGAGSAISASQGALPLLIRTV